MSKAMVLVFLCTACGAEVDPNPEALDGAECLEDFEDVRACIRSGGGSTACWDRVTAGSDSDAWWALSECSLDRCMDVTTRDSCLTRESEPSEMECYNALGHCRYLAQQ